MKAIRRFFRSAGPVNAASSLIAILVGLVFGGLILLISNPGQALQGLGIIVAGGFGGGMKGVGQTLYYATPLIMTGLSVGFAFKTGLFNIGASGQLITGGLAAIYVGVNWTWLPDPLHWVVALLAAMVVGGLWGAIPGILKAKLNVNEVIACIMCNYIGMYGVNYLIKNSPSIYDQLRNQTVSVDPAAAIPKWGLDQVFYNLKGNYHDVSSVNGGILLAILLAVLMYVLLNKTVFGYELKACGYNRHASKLAGHQRKPLHPAVHGHCRRAVRHRRRADVPGAGDGTAYRGGRRSLGGRVQRHPRRAAGPVQSHRHHLLRPVHLAYHAGRQLLAAPELYAGDYRYHHRRHYLL